MLETVARVFHRTILPPPVALSTAYCNDVHERKGLGVSYRGCISRDGVLAIQTCTHNELPFINMRRVSNVRFATTITCVAHV